MSLIIKRSDDQGFDKELISEGTIQMVVSGVFDLGIQEVKKYKSEETEHKRQVMICFEVGETFTTGDYAGKSKKYYKRYKYSMHKKSALFSLIKALVGGAKADKLAEKGFDLYKIIGLNCFGTFEQEVSQSGNKYNSLINVSEPIKGVAKLEVEDLLLDDDSAPDWIKRIKDISIDSAKQDLEDILDDEEPPRQNKVAPKIKPVEKEVKKSSKARIKPEDLFDEEDEEDEDDPFN